MTARDLSAVLNGPTGRRIATAVVVVIVLLSTYAFYIMVMGTEPLREEDGAVTYEMRDLPRSFYKSWSYATLSIYSGEPIMGGDPHYILYPVDVYWRLNSTALLGPKPTVHDFGLRNISGAWFNLTVTDVAGDGYVGRGDHLTVCSMNGSFSEDVVYYMRFSVSLYGGMAPFYIVLGFKFSRGGFDSWVEWGPNTTAL